MSRLTIEDLESNILTDLDDKESTVISGGFVQILRAYVTLAKAVIWATEKGGSVYGDSLSDPRLEALRGGNLGA